MNKILYLLNDVSDPYEPSFTSAVCESLEDLIKLAKDNKLTELWDWHVDLKRNYICRNLLTGETKEVSQYGFPPSPYISTMELNKYYPMSPQEEDDD